MSHEQYWCGDVWAVIGYREADKLRQQRVNNEAWLQGMYVYDAIGRIAPVLHAFAKKGTKPKDYLSQPYDFGEKKKAEAPTEQMIENERLKSILFFKNWAKAAGKKFDP